MSEKGSSLRLRVFAVKKREELRGAPLWPNPHGRSPRAKRALISSRTGSASRIESTT